jgi:hypothetical protein
LHITTSNNQTDKSNKETSQMGGTMLLTVSDTVHHIVKSSSDPQGLGRDGHGFYYKESRAKVLKWSHFTVPMQLMGR